MIYIRSGSVIEVDVLYVLPVLFLVLCLDVQLLVYFHQCQ